MSKPYTEPCRVCFVYRVSDFENPVCVRCREEARQNREALERAQAYDKQQRRSTSPTSLPCPQVPYCGSCLTTMYLRDVDPNTNVGVCVMCKVKRQPPAKGGASSYGPGPVHKGPVSDPNRIY